MARICYKQALASVLRLTIRTTPRSLTSSTLGAQLPFAASGYTRQGLATCSLEPTLGTT